MCKHIQKLNNTKNYSYHIIRSLVNTFILLNFSTYFIHKSPFQFHIIINLFHAKKVTRSLVTFTSILMSEKKEEVYNILIINNLYINILFFREKFIEKWPVTEWLSQITTFNVLIFNILRTPKGHFFGSLLSNTVTFCLGSSAHFPHFFALNR